MKPNCNQLIGVIVTSLAWVWSEINQLSKLIEFVWFVLLGSSGQSNSMNTLIMSNGISD